MEMHEKTGQSKRLAVAIGPPPSTEVEYFRETTISVIVTSQSDDRLLIETITLRFQSDTEASSLLVAGEHCGWEIGKDEQRELHIKVSPTPVYLENTNRFDVLVQYRIIKGVPGKLIPEKHDGAYLILRRPKTSLGKIFISFKQPQDLSPARILRTLAERTGFGTYRAIQEPTPGKDLWDRITPEIENSAALFVLWTNSTLWGEGVQREMEIARKASVPIVLLIEKGMEPPDGFEGKVEYMSFEPQDPAPTFAESLQAQRKIKLASS